MLFLLVFICVINKCFIKVNMDTGSGSNSLRVTREQRWVTDVLEAAVKHHNSFKTESTSTVRIGTVFHGLEVVVDGLGVNSLLNCSLFQENWVVNTLSTWQDFLTSHEEVIRAGKSGVILTEHSVERSGVDRVSVQHVEVSVIFNSHYDKWQSYLTLPASFRWQCRDPQTQTTQHRFPWGVEYLQRRSVWRRGFCIWRE